MDTKIIVMIHIPSILHSELILSGFQPNFGHLGNLNCENSKLSRKVALFRASLRENIEKISEILDKNK